MTSIDRQSVSRVPVSRHLLSFLITVFILLATSVISWQGETASSSKEDLDATERSAMIRPYRVPSRLTHLETASLNFLAATNPSVLIPVQPLLVLEGPDDVVISQVYGGGGNTGSVYKNDFIELFNQGTTTVNLNGWTVQYAAVNGNSWQKTTLSGSLAPGHYYLVKEAQGAGGTQQLPLPDATGTIPMNAIDGKLALLNGAGCLNGPSDPNGFDCNWAGTVIKDLVGSGSGATSYEGSGPAVGQSNTVAILRGAKGCIDLNDNTSDFDPGSPNPRNNGTIATQCVTPNPSTTVVISEFRTRGPNGVNDEFVELYNKTTSSINIGGWKIKASKSNGQISTRVTIAGNTILPGHYHFLATNTSAPGYSGTVPGNQTFTTDITDNGGLAITRADDSIVDQVGMNAGSAFKEGRVLDQFTTNTDRSYERKPGGVSGSGQDTDDGRSDFIIRPTCNPQNLQSNPVPDSTPPSATGVKIVHIDVGQGDSTLIIGPSRTLLFDGGITGSGTQIRNVLNANGITSLDYFVAGHYHVDHVGAIDELINGGITIGTSYDRGGTYATQSFTEYIAAIGSNRATIALNQQIDLGGGCILTCIAVDGHTNHGNVTPTDENDRSIALVLRYGTFDYLIASDLTGGGISTANVEAFCARDAGDVDVLHVNHHGSNSSTNQNLVDTVRPQQAVISLGNGNTLGHPMQAVLDRLTASAMVDTIWQTETGAGGTSSKVRVGGNITIVTNGTVYSVTNSLNGLNLSYSTDGITGGPLPGPQAVTGGPYAGNIATIIGFNGGGSLAPGGSITSHQWDFGDNASGTGVTPSHSYAAAGTYNVTLTITDNTGAMANAQTTVAVNGPPTVTLTSPSNNAVFTAPASIVISASASDVDGTVSKVDFYQGAILIGTATASPYVVTWGNVAAGTYSLTATATDNSNAVTTSSAVNVIVNPANSPPTVSLTSPTNNARFTSGATVTLNASAADSDGTIAKVEFFQGATKLGEDTTSPYSFDWTDATSGAYVLTARATDSAAATATSAAVNIIVMAQAKQYVGWSAITNGIDLGNGSVRKTTSGTWDFSATALQTLLPGDGYFESTAASYNQAISISAADGSVRTFLVGTGGWAAIYENGAEMAATSGHIPNETISPHVVGDRYRLEITNGILRYVRYRGGSRAIVFVSPSAVPPAALWLSLASSPQNAEWQRTVVSQLTRTGTWSSIIDGVDLGNGSLRKTSSEGWGFHAVSKQQLLRGNGYVESTASSYNQAISLSGTDGSTRTLMVGTGGWAAIYENGLEVAASYGRPPNQTISPHVSGDRYRLEIASGTLRYVRFRTGSREVLFASPGSLPVYPLSLSLDASPQNAEWQNTVLAQISQNASWSSIINGSDLGAGSVVKTSTTGWDFSASPQQQLVYGNGYFESTTSSYNQSIQLGGIDGADRALLVGSGGWVAIYENGVEVAATSGHGPNETISPHAVGDRYRLEISDAKLRYVRYRSSTRSIVFTSIPSLPAYPLSFALGASPQNAEWQNSIFSDNLQEHNSAAFVSQSVPAAMSPSLSYNVAVRMKNNGASTWTVDNYRLASENPQNNLTWGLSGVNLPADVPPGTEVNFNFTVTAPATPGTYNFQWRTNQETVERFGAFTPNLSIPTVNGLPSVALTSPANNAVFSSGATVALGANAADSDGTITKVEFLQGSTIIGEDLTSPYSFNWNNVVIGTYALTARSTDNGGATATSTIVNITVNAANQLPTAYAGGPYSGLSGAPIQLNSGGSMDPDGTIASYQWNFGDGTSGVGQTPTHVYSAVGSYSPLLTVTDNLGGTAVASAPVVVTSPSNQLPVAVPGGPYSAVSGTSVQFNGSGSYDPDGSISVYHWEFADSGTAEIAAPTHTFAASGTHIVTLKVTDNGGATSWTSLNINVAPAAGENQPQSAIDVSWDPTNRGSLDDPGNDRGNRANRSEGNNNFQITAPILSQPGRGLDLNLNLIYNSLLWNKAGNEMAFDLDQDWPAPGWQLGFGKMVAMGTAGALLIEPDGTRHSFTGTVFNDVWPVPIPLTTIVPTFKGRTTDGSLIEYRCENVNGAAVPEGLARYPNGTVVFYKNYSTDFSVPHTYLYPYKIIDANGNTISITYLWDLREPRLQRIVDSLGRVTTFNYDTQKRLTSVTAPGLLDTNGNATTQTYVRLHYATKPLELGGAFNGLTLRVRNPSPVVIDAIYYPATGLGYWLPANDAYSSYGMLKKVVEQRGMGFSSSGGNEQGTITPGTITRQQDYDYPAAPAGLTSAPTFSNVTESWDGGSSSNVTNLFMVSDSVTKERTVTVTNPDQTKNIQKSHYYSNPPESDPNKFKDGLVKEEQVLDTNGHLLSKTIFSWLEGVDKSPRIVRMETTDELGNVVATDYDQFGGNNSIGRIRERGYDGSIIRTTLNTYDNYLDGDIDLRIYFEFHNVFHPRRVNLVNSVSVFEGDNAANKMVSRTEFRYDEYAVPLLAYPADSDNSIDITTFGEPLHGPIHGILLHSYLFNPSPPALDGGAGANYFTKRGNVTSLTKYANTTNAAQPANPITETRTYDMAGNVISASKLCCEQTSSTFSLPTQYAFPVSKTRGSTDPSSLVRVTTSAAYDLNTGLQLSVQDENGRTTFTDYYPQSLRPKEIIFPTGARASIEYDDLAMKVTQTTRLSLNGVIAIQTTKYLNGLGQVRREEAVGANNVVDVVETLYDQFGRLAAQSLPYRLGDSAVWKRTIYDAAGRMLESREPPDPSGITGDLPPTTKYFYNESTRPPGASNDPGQTTRIVDTWDRWRWARLDSEGRVAEVVEPNPSGSTGFRTRYSYDALGNLVQVSQGDPVQQVRRFRYDSLGRLTHQKLAETSATLNVSGVWDVTGVPEDKWSDVFSYDQHSNLITHVDARGVKATFKYTDNNNQHDPLNRLQAVSFDLAGVPASLTVLPTATVNYQYRTKNSPSDLVDVTQSKQVEIVNVGIEDYNYDLQGRIEEKHFTFAGRSLPMTTTYAYDNLGRLASTTYPEQYHDNVQNPTRKVVTSSYDNASRIKDVRVNNADYASQINYNPASQITSLTVGNGSNQVSETYSYELATALLSTEEVKRGATTLMSLRYEYRRSYCEGPGACTALPASYLPSGQVTRVMNPASGQGKIQHFSYDAVGRLSKADQGAWSGAPTLEFVTDWTQNYSYDPYGNRTGVVATNTSGVTPVPQDGSQSLSFDMTSNRITSPGFVYDPAGNLLQNNSGQSFVYDAAGRLAQVKTQAGTTVLATYTYGTSNHRMITQTGNVTSTDKTYYLWEGDSVVAEYAEQTSATMPKWTKNYIYLGGRLLATEEPSGSGEIVRYHHPDRLGTKLVTNNVDTTSFQQSNLPFGTALDAESTGTTNRRFTSYDRSATTGLDYAVNRHYDSRQGRFMQPDSLGMGAANVSDPQSLNMYAYAGNDPMNRLDPDGQFWGALLHFIGGLFRGLKPNVINGSFAYHNNPPISVSFTTNFQNLRVGYGGIGLGIRNRGLWLPAMLSSAIELGGEHLSTCLKDKLRPFFPDQKVWGSTFSAVDEIQFFAGVPQPYKRFPIRAITLGVDVHYDPDAVTLSGGSGKSLIIMIEELAHVEQFFKVWAGMPGRPRVAILPGSTSVIPSFPVFVPYTISPTYGQAKAYWKGVYATAVIHAKANLHDSYDNIVEWTAQNKVSDIAHQLSLDAEKNKQDNICGFRLDFNTQWRAIW